jgi:sulfate permease, SulP family
METGPGESPFRRAQPAPLVERALPIARDLRGYGAGAARSDVLAGLTVAALAIPSGMAYAQLAGLTPVIGLYALLLPVVAYALLGSSRQVAVGPEGTLAALVAAALIGVAAPATGGAAQAAAAISVMVGAFFFITRLARLEWIAEYLSRPVLVGYLHGVAVVLIVGQLGKLLGIPLHATDPIGQLGDVLDGLGDVSGNTALVSLAALTILFGARAGAPKVPAALVIVVGGIAASELLDLVQHGVATVGAVPAGLPTPSLPRPEDWLVLAPAAAGIFLVDFADEVLTARSYAARRGDRVDVGQELVAMGVANVAAGVTRGMPIGASGSRSAVNEGMGAVSQVSGLVAAVAVALVLLVLTGPIADLPTAILGAAIVAAAVGLIEPAAWRRLWATDRVETAIAAVTAAGVVLTGVLQAVVFAVGLSIVDVVRRSAHPHDAVLGWDPELGRYADVAERPDAIRAPGVVVYRLDDRLFYANTSYVTARVLEAVRGAPGPEPVRTLVFDAGAVSHVDAAALGGLDELIELLARRDVALVLARVKGPLADTLRAAGIVERLGGERALAPTVRAAVEAAAGERSPAPGGPASPGRA